METKIIKQEKNPFLEREEFTLEIKNNISPNFEDIKNALGKDKNLTVVKRIDGNFGEQIFTAEAVVYDNKEAMKKIETIPQKIRKKMETEEKAAAESAKKAEAAAKKAEEEAKAAEAAAAETPAEEVTEEPAAEETE